MFYTLPWLCYDRYESAAVNPGRWAVHSHNEKKLFPPLKKPVGVCLLCIPHNWRVNLSFATWAWDGLVIKKITSNYQLQWEWVRETIESAGNLIKIFFRSAVMAKGCPTNASPTPMRSTYRGIKQYEDKLCHWFANHFNHSNQAF